MGWGFTLTYNNLARWWRCGSIQVSSTEDRWFGVVGHSRSTAEAAALLEMALRWPAGPTEHWPLLAEAVWICTDSKVALFWATGLATGNAEPASPTKYGWNFGTFVCFIPTDVLFSNTSQPTRGSQVLK